MHFNILTYSSNKTISGDLHMKLMYLEKCISQMIEVEQKIKVISLKNPTILKIICVQILRGLVQN